MTLLDCIVPVDGTPQDLRTPGLLTDAIPRFPQQHGGLYPVPAHSELRPAELGQMLPIAQLIHPETGIVLTCSTNETHLQVYTASALECIHPGKSGKPYPEFAGICFECEGYANGANAPHIGDVILRPGNSHATQHRIRILPSAHQHTLDSARPERDRMTDMSPDRTTELSRRTFLAGPNASLR